MDPAKMKVVDLRSELGALGLDTKGNKPALVERLKKALEARTGKAVPDTSILDTSTEDVEEPATPTQAPASRTTRRTSSSRIGPTPAKIPREDLIKTSLEEKPIKNVPIPEENPVDTKPPVPVKTPEDIKYPVFIKTPDEIMFPERIKTSEDVKPPVPVKTPEDIKPPVPVKTPEDIKPPVPIKTPEDIKPPVPVKTPEDIKPPVPVKTPEDIKPPVPIKTPEDIKPPVPVKTPEDIKPPVFIKTPESVKAPEPILKPVKNPEPEPIPEIKLEKYIKKERSASPQPVPEQVPKPVPEPVVKQEHMDPETSHSKESELDDDIYDIDDLSKSPVIEIKAEKEEVSENHDKEEKEEDSKNVEKNEDCKNDMEERKELYLQHQIDRDLSEQEEWDLLNERLIQKEKERVEREKQQAEEDAKKIEELSKDPVKFQRLKRKQEKKTRWANFYKTMEVTNQVLAPPFEEPPEARQEETETDIIEPDLDDSKVTLSWYDSDLNQYLELPELNSVIPLSESAFSHAWAGARATHGAVHGKLCYEVRVGIPAATTEISEKEPAATGLRVGWSTIESPLHLGEDSLSWGYENTGRVVNNSEYKDYGKQFNSRDVIGCYLDLDSTPCKISYTLNGEELGTAYEFDKEVLDGKALFPHLLTKNMCYKLNMGYNRYTMMTKTKIIRHRFEIPVEQVLEEKRLREEQIKKEMEDEMRKEKEKKDSERKEREGRESRKKEEKPKDDQNKDSDIQDKIVTQEEMEVDQEKNAEKNQEENVQSEKETEVKEEAMETEEDGEEKLKENGDKAEKALPVQKTEVNEIAQSKDDNSEPQEVTEEQVIGGLVLDKNIKFVIRYVVDEELEGSEAKLLPGYQMMTKCDLVDGPRRPATCQECEVILMVGMPGAGKTHWAKQHCANNPDKRYNILSTGALFEKMKVDCKPYRSSYEGKWDAMVSKCAKCILKLLEIAKGRRRNYILDQTNVYPSAQRRKLREFDGYRRIAAVVVVDDEEQKKRVAAREAADGKEVPDAAILDMKANFTLPEKGSFVDEIIYTELNEERAREILEAYHAEAQAAGALKERDKRARSASRDAPKRPRSPERPRDHRRPREHPRERDEERKELYDRWSGGSRWGPPAPRGRWGRDRPPHPRFDRNWPQRNEFNRERESFRGGRMGQGPRQERGPAGPRGPPVDRYPRETRPVNRVPPMPDKRPPGPGSWQRGTGSRGGHMPHGPRQPDNQNQNQNQNQNPNQPQNQQAWNQWAGGWGGWGNWNNQNAGGWNNWNNWGWGGQNQGQGQAPAPSQGPAPQQGQGQVAKGQGPGPQGQMQGQQGQWQNYNAQQWYQWQQWQQQHWPGYGQQQQQGAASNADNAQAWAQFYQNYGAGNNGNNSNQAIEKK